MAYLLLVELLDRILNLV